MKLSFVATITATLALAAASSPARAYERATVDGTTDVYLYWSTRRVDYYVNRRGTEDVSLAETLGAIRRSFFTWSGESCTDMYFNFAGTTNSSASNLSNPNDEPDKKNLIVWREDAWPPAGAADDGSVTPEMAALTVILYNADTGEIIDADIDLNGNHFFWTTKDKEGATDVQNVVTHEVGHLIGLAHSSVAESTMFGSTPQGEISKRDLHQDDRDALCTIYPFDEATPLGPNQKPPNGEVQGATGCMAAATPAANGLVVTLGVLLQFAALAWLRRRRRSAPRRCAILRGPPPR